MNNSKLQKAIEQAFGAYRANPGQDASRDRLGNILDILESDMVELMRNSGSEGTADEYSDTEDLAAILPTNPVDAFSAGISAYTFNPFNAEDKSEGFNHSCEYIALDGYARIMGIRDRLDLACWYQANIWDYLNGNYGEPSEEVLEELAEALGVED